MGFSDFIVRMFAPVADVLSFLPRATAATPSIAAQSPTASIARRRWFERLDQWYWQQRQRALEAQLADSTNIVELEARLRDIGRVFPPRYY